MTRRERNDRIFLSFLFSLFPHLFIIVCKHCSICLNFYRLTFLWYIFLSPILYYFPIIFVFNFSICTLSSYSWYWLQLSMLERICIIASLFSVSFFPFLHLFDFLSLSSFLCQSDPHPKLGPSVGTIPRSRPTKVQYGLR